MTQSTTDNRLTNSRLRTARTCLRKHLLQYELGIRAVRDAKPLHIGAAIHVGLEAYYTHLDRDVEAAVLAALESYDTNPPLAGDDEAEHEWQCNRMMVATMLRLYFWRWKDHDDQIEWLAVEQEFTHPIVNPETGRAGRIFEMAGKIDGIVVLPSGKVAIVEHKTASEDISTVGNYWRKLRMDGQVSTYWIAAQQMGYEPQEVLYDVIRKPQFRPSSSVPMLDDMGVKIVLDADGNRVKKKNGEWRQTADKEKGYVLQTRRETPEEYAQRVWEAVTAAPDEYFVRRSVPRLQSDLDEYAFDVWQLQGMLRECQRIDRWPRNQDACITIYGPCEYFDLCADGFDVEQYKLSGMLPDGYHATDTVNHELQENTND